LDNFFHDRLFIFCLIALLKIIIPPHAHYCLENNKIYLEAVRNTKILLIIN